MTGRRPSVTSTSAGPRSSEAAGGGDRRRGRREVGEVVDAGLDDVAAGDDRAEPVEVGRPVGDDAGPAVRIEHHDRPGRNGRHRVRDRGGHRLQHETERADVERGGAGREGVAHRTGRQPRRGRALRVEPVDGPAVRVQVRDGQRRRRVGRLGHRQVDAVAGQGVAQPRAEPVGRQAAEERDLATEPADRPRGVERTAPGRGGHRPIRPDQEVDEGLTSDDDHGPDGTGRRTLPAMDRRTDAVELLDGPLDDPAALVGNLRDLRRVNRWLDGVTLSAGAIDALAAHRHEVTLIDVGTGGADIPLALLARATARARRPVDRRHRQPAGGPRRGRPRHTRARGHRRDRAPRRRRAVAPLPRPVVRRRPHLDGHPSLHPGRGGHA